jgi:hypothetical protein
MAGRGGDRRGVARRDAPDNAGKEGEGLERVELREAECVDIGDW